MAKGFSITINPKELSKGLRHSKRVPRNTKLLISCIGAVGKDGVLSALDEISRIDTSSITDSFPYPQIFVLTNMIIICSSTKIYELVDGELVLRLTTTAGSSWTVVGYFNYVYMSNGIVSVTRNPDTGVYTETSDLPTAQSILDFNGQVMIGAPDVNAPGIGLTIKAGELTLTATQRGSWV